MYLLCGDVHPAIPVYSPRSICLDSIGSQIRLKIGNVYEPAVDGVPSASGCTCGWVDRCSAPHALSLCSLSGNVCMQVSDGTACRVVQRNTDALHCHTGLVRLHKALIYRPKSTAHLTAPRRPSMPCRTSNCSCPEGMHCSASRHARLEASVDVCCLTTSITCCVPDLVWKLRMKSLRHESCIVKHVHLQ